MNINFNDDHFTEIEDVSEIYNSHIDSPRELKHSQYSKPNITINHENIKQNKNKSTSILSTVQPLKKRDLTYDDILGSMNLKVTDGQLQYISSSRKIPPIGKNYSTTPIIITPVSPPIPLKKTSTFPQLVSPVFKTEFNRKEINRKIFERRIKSTKLLFTNNNTESFIPSIKSTDRFFKLK